VQTSGRSDDLLDGVRTRYPAQVHITPRAATLLVQLNTTRRRSTASQRDAAWHSPSFVRVSDFARAGELVKRSGTRGMRVDMITESGTSFSNGSEVVADTRISVTAPLKGERGGAAPHSSRVSAHVALRVTDAGDPNLF
jgi:hypothetical protein